MELENTLLESVALLLDDLEYPPVLQINLSYNF